MIVPLTDPEEIKAYYAGYEGAEFGKKDYGDFPDYSDDVDEAAMSNIRRLAGMNEAPAQMGSYLGIKTLKAPPLKGYRPAIWENMLGTVYAMNDAGKIEYFDYDHDAAKAFAGIGPDSAPRLYRVNKQAYGKPYGEYRYGDDDGYASPNHGKLVLWVKKNTAPAAAPEQSVKEATLGGEKYKGQENPNNEITKAIKENRAKESAALQAEINAKINMNAADNLTRERVAQIQADVDQGRIDLETAKYNLDNLVE